MMADYKNTPLELDGRLPKELYKIVEDKWHLCLKVEKEMRESSLASLLPNLTKRQIVSAVKRNNNRFTPKYRAFSILQNKIEEVMQESTRLWKIVYKKVEDVFEEEYEAEASAKLEQRREKEAEKRTKEKGEEEKIIEEEKEKEEINKGDELE